MVGVTYQEIHLFVEFLKEQYGQGRPDYIEALTQSNTHPRPASSSCLRVWEYITSSKLKFFVKKYLRLSLRYLITCLHF